MSCIYDVTKLARPFDLPNALKHENILCLYFT